MPDRKFSTPRTVRIGTVDSCNDKVVEEARPCQLRVQGWRCFEPADLILGIDGVLIRGRRGYYSMENVLTPHVKIERKRGAAKGCLTRSRRERLVTITDTWPIPAFTLRFSSTSKAAEAASELRYIQRSIVDSLFTVLPRNMPRFPTTVCNEQVGADVALAGYLLYSSVGGLDAPGFHLVWAEIHLSGPHASGSPCIVLFSDHARTSLAERIPFGRGVLQFSWDLFTVSRHVIEMQPSPRLAASGFAEKTRRAFSFRSPEEAEFWYKFLQSVSSNNTVELIAGTTIELESLREALITSSVSSCFSAPPRQPLLPLCTPPLPSLLAGHVLSASKTLAKVSETDESEGNAHGAACLAQHPQ